GIPEEWDGQWSIAALESSGVEVSYQTSWTEVRDGDDTANSVWKAFAADGKLPNRDTSWVSSGEPISAAIAVRFTLKPGEKKTVPMVISWDNPVVKFGSGRKWYRHYTDFYGTTGKNAWKIARDGLLNAAKWSDAIDAWQAPYVNDESKPL